MTSVLEQLAPDVQERLSRQFGLIRSQSGASYGPDDVIIGSKEVTMHEGYAPGIPAESHIVGHIVAGKDFFLFSGDDPHETWRLGQFALGNVGAYHYDAGMFRMLFTRLDSWFALSCGPTIGLYLDDLASRAISDPGFSSLMAQAGKNAARVHSALNHEGAPPTQSVHAVETAKFIKWPLPGASKYGALVATNRRLYASPDSGPGEFLEWWQIAKMTMQHKFSRGDHISIWVEGEPEPRIAGTHMGFFETIQALHAVRTGPI